MAQHHSKSRTPLRRTHSSRLNAAAADVPVTASMEQLPPEQSPQRGPSGLPGSSNAEGHVFKQGSVDSGAAGGKSPMGLQASRSRSLRRTTDVFRDREGVVQLRSTRGSDATTDTQGPPVELLLLQLPSRLSGSSTAAAMDATLRSHRYDRSPGPLQAGGGAAVTRGTALRPASAATSMLLGGVPGPWPSATPGACSRTWTPESELCAFDDSANSRASTVERPSATVSPDGRVWRVTSLSPDPQAAAGLKEQLWGQPGCCSRQTERSEADGDAFVAPCYDDDDIQPRPDCCMPSPARLSVHRLQTDSKPNTTSVTSRPGTPQSVASGVTGSGIFFTALRRSLGTAPTGPGDGGLGDGQSGPSALHPEISMHSARSMAPSDVLSCVSFANPMQEPSGALHSARAHGPSRVAAVEVAAEAEEETSGGSVDGSQGTRADADAELADYLSAYDATEASATQSVWENPVQTPRDTTPPTEEPSRTSFMSLLKDLYADGSADVDVAQSDAPGCSVNASSRPETFSSTSTASEDASDSGSGGDGGEGGALLRVLEAAERMQAEQQARRAELATYIADLQAKVGEDGGALVELPRNYHALVQQLLGSRKAEYASLAGWLGPHRFEDLPIMSVLTGNHRDAKVSEGLTRIQALDARLANKEAEAVILARERDPEGWAAAERARLARQAAAVEAALKKERMRRMRAAQVARAVASDAGHGDGRRESVTGSVASTQHSAPVPGRLVLRDEDEALVETVLARNDADDDANPFILLPTASMVSLDASLHLDPLNGAGDAYEPATPRLVLAPLALSRSGESGAMWLLHGARQVAAQMPAAGRIALQGGAGAQGEQEHGTSGRETIDLMSAAVAVPALLELGLVLHSRALLRAQQAAVAGMSLADIDAHLERLSAGHKWTPDGLLADFATVRHSAPISGPAVSAQVPRRTTSGQPGTEPQPAPAARPSSASTGRASGAGAPLQPPSAATAVTHVSQRRDYLREERETKELQAREAELDARIRAFKTSDPAGTKLAPGQLAALVAECRALAERAVTVGPAAPRPSSAPGSTRPPKPPTPEPKPPPGALRRASGHGTGMARSQSSMQAAGGMSVPVRNSKGGVSPRSALSRHSGLAAVVVQEQIMPQAATGSPKHDLAAA